MQRLCIFTAKNFPFDFLDIALPLRTLGVVPKFDFQDLASHIVHLFTGVILADSGKYKQSLANSRD